MSDEQLAAGEIEYGVFPTPGGDEDYYDDFPIDGYVDPMAPLQEEQDAPALTSAPRQVASNDPTHRRLRAIAGAGVPYVFITFPGAEATLDFSGIESAELLAGVLRETAEAISK